MVKTKKPDELIIANKELAFQNKEKNKRASELIIARKELVFQNKEKEKRAAELVIAKKELVFQNVEKEKRAAELSIANKELVIQNEEKEKLAFASQYARRLLEASLDPLVTISAEGKITDVNEASIKVTGILRENLLDTDFSSYFTEPEKAQEGYLQVFKKGFVSDYPLTIRHKNGNLTDVLYNASVYKDDKGNVLGVFAAARDVTEQKWAIDLRIANKELAFQNTEKEKRAAELSIANKELAFQNDQKEKRAEELIIANKELAYQNEVKEKRAAELANANEELAYQNKEKEKRAAELGIANKELAFQNKEKEKRAAELGIANKELAFQNNQKETRAEELVIANKELAYQNEVKEKRAAELVIANEELAFQNHEKEKRAAELVIANEELAFQNHEKEKRAAELHIASIELVYQNDEKENRAAELVVANKELAFQNEEKEKRAAELVIANKELVFQNKEKGKRAAELVIANKELVFQNDEKEKRAAELVLANKNLKKAQHDIRKLNEELEQKVIERTAQLEAANKELESFSYSVSHDLRSPLRAVHGYARILQEDFGTKLEPETIRIINNIIINSKKMGQLIDDLLAFSQIGRKELKKINIPMYEMTSNLCEDIKNENENRNISFKINKLSPIQGDSAAIKQVWINLISNAVKYSKLIKNAIIEIGSKVKGNDIIYFIKDNGAGFDMRYADKLFGVFQRLHTDEKFEGTGVGLAIVHRIISKHGGKIWAESKINKGATFHFSLPRDSSMTNEP